MVTYKVTTELNTPWWLKLLRFFRLKKKREEFELSFKKDWYRTGDILDSGSYNLKIIGRVSKIKCTGNNNNGCFLESCGHNCGCVISWGVGFYDVKENKDITHNVTNIFVDNFSSMVKVTIQKGLKVYAVDFTMEHAQEIRFINIKALSNYC